MELEKQIIIVNGVNGAGKSSFVNYCRHKAIMPAAEYSSVDTIKSIMHRFFGWNGEKDEKSRKMMCELKKAWINYNNGPFNEMCEFISSTNALLIFAHIREPLEIRKVKDYWPKVHTVLIKNTNVTVAENDSDKVVDFYKYDTVINNIGDQKNLELKAKDFLLYFGYGLQLDNRRE